MICYLVCSYTDWIPYFGPRDGSKQCTSGLPGLKNVATRLARSNVGGGKSCVPNGPEDEAEPECLFASFCFQNKLVDELVVRYQ